MVTHTPAPTQGATAKLTVLLAEDRSRPLNPGEPQKFSTTLDGQPVVTRSGIPMYDSCRVLLSWGMTGKVEFVGDDGKVRMTMDIEAGAKLTIDESPTGPRVRKHRPKGLVEDGASGKKLPSASQAAIDSLFGAVAEIDNMSDEERELLDGGVL